MIDTGKCACCDTAAVAYSADRDAWTCLEHYLPQDQAPWAAKVTELTVEVERLREVCALLKREKEEMAKRIAALTDAVDMRTRYSAKEALLTEAGEMLKELEWEGSYEQYCPTCLAMRSAEPHSPDCKLSTLIRKIKEASNE